MSFIHHINMFLIVIFAILHPIYGTRKIGDMDFVEAWKNGPGNGESPFRTESDSPKSEDSEISTILDIPELEHSLSSKTIYESAESELSNSTSFEKSETKKDKEKVVDTSPESEYSSPLSEDAIEKSEQAILSGRHREKLLSDSKTPGSEQAKEKSEHANCGINPLKTHRILSSEPETPKTEYRSSELQEQKDHQKPEETITEAIKQLSEQVKNKSLRKPSVRFFLPEAIPATLEPEQEILAKMQRQNSKQNNKKGKEKVIEEEITEIRTEYPCESEKVKIGSERNEKRTARKEDSNRMGSEQTKRTEDVPLTRSEQEKKRVNDFVRTYFDPNPNWETSWKEDKRAHRNWLDKMHLRKSTKYDKKQQQQQQLADAQLLAEHIKSGLVHFVQGDGLDDEI